MQLRNLVWATTKHDVYLMSHSSVIHWSSLTCSTSDVLVVSGHVKPTEVSVCDHNLDVASVTFFVFVVLTYLLLESSLKLIMIFHLIETSWKSVGRIYTNSS